MKRCGERPGGRILRRARLAVSSLRTKLLLFSLLLVLVPGAVFGLVAISNGRRALTEAVGRQLAEEARSASDALSGTLDSELTDLRTSARQDLMREIRIGDLDKRISAFLVSLKHGHDSILDLQVTDLEGRVVAASNPERIGETDPLFATAASGAPTRELLRGPFVLPQSKRRALELGVPVPDPDGRESSIGRLTAFYDWDRETTALKEIRRNLLGMGLEVDMLITDGSGVVIGGAVAEQSRTPIGADLRSAGWSAVGQGLPAAASGFVVERAARALVGYTRLAEGMSPWTILVTQPLSKALRPVKDMTIRLAIGLATVLAAALGLAVLLAGRIAGPLRELTRATRAVASGERSVVVVAARSKDEVGELTAAFNQMSVDLRRAQSEVLEVAKFAFVGELAAGVAHEVRTALGVLRSSAQILQPSLGARDAEASELIQIMLEQIDHLDGVVTQLLNLGRPRELAIAPTRLSDVVFRAVDFVEPQARGKAVVLRRDGRVQNSIALCDEEQIYQVALNLLVNAVQVVSPGGEITVALLPERDRMAGFEVRDNGPGMPDEVREKIFHPFFTRRDGGIGLGLAIVQRVVQEHRGRLSVDSQVGRGSVFRVELPASEIRE